MMMDELIARSKALLDEIEFCPALAVYCYTEDIADCKNRINEGFSALWSADLISDNEYDYAENIITDYCRELVDKAYAKARAYR